MPVLPRLLLTGATTAVSAGGAKVGLDVGGSISKNLDLTSAIKNSPHSNPQIDRIPSPDVFHSFLNPSEVNVSFLDSHSPLEVLLTKTKNK
jgi:hypothetical protein